MKRQPISVKSSLFSVVWLLTGIISFGFQQEMPVASAAECVSLPPGAIAWWRAESNTVDTIGVHDARSGVSDPFNFYVAGKVSTAFSLTTRRYLTVPESDDLVLGRGPGLTIECWIRPSFAGPLTEWNDGRGIIGVGLRLGSNHVLEAYLTDTNATPTPRSVLLQSQIGAVTNFGWQHVALTFEKASGVATIYVNGSSLASTNLGTFTPQTQTPVYLGFRPSGPASGNYFEGGMDEVTLYNRALTAFEIQSIVAAGEAGKCPPPPPACLPVRPDIVSWYRAESNALDSVDSNHGQISNSVAYTDGEVEKAFQFQKGFVRIPAASNLNVGLGSGLTVEMWVKPTLQITEPFLEWYNTPIGLPGIYLAANDNPKRLEASLVDTNNISHLIRSFSTVVSSGVWQHVAVTYDKSAGLARLYLNGSIVGQFNVGSFTPRTSGDVYLGFRPSNSLGAGLLFTGALDEVGIYRRALGAEEIRGIVLARTAGKCTDAPVIVQHPASQIVTPKANASFTVMATGTPNLRFQWRFNGADIMGATDSVLSLTNVQKSQEGNYSVRVANAFGAVVSSNAFLIVNQTPIARCGDVIVPAGSDCRQLAAIDRGSSDPDGNPITLTQSPPGPYPLGTNLVSLTVNDVYGFTDSCSAFVIVMDLEPPTISCPSDVAVTNAHNAWTSIVTYDLPVIDNCPDLSPPICSPPSGSAFGIGLHTVVCTAVDGSGNSSQCSFRLTVYPGNVPPIPVIEVSPLARFPGATNLIVIATNALAATIRLDGSKAHDVDDSHFYYFWYEGTNLLSTNVTVNLTLSVGNHLITLLLDDTYPMGTNSTSVSIEVIPPAEAVTIVMDLLDNSNFRANNLEPLIASLKVAKASFERNNGNAALNQLEAFRKKVEGQLATSDRVLADKLLRSVQILTDAVRGL